MHSGQLERCKEEGHSQLPGLAAVGMSLSPSFTPSAKLRFLERPVFAIEDAPGAWQKTRISHDTEGGCYAA